MSEYTPTLDHARALYVTGTPVHVPVAEANAEFDRWLAAHDEQVRNEERERCLKAVERSDADRTSGALRGKLAAMAAIRAVPEQEEHHD